MTAPPPVATPADIRRRREFARTHLADARGRGDIPGYGTADWHAMPYDSPMRWAAVLIAAECWARDGDNLPARLAQDLAQHTSITEQLAAEDFADVAATVRARAGQPTHAVLQHRRGEITNQQLATYEQDWARFLAGEVDQAPRVPRAGVA